MSEFNKALEIQRLQLAESKDPALDAPLHLDGINKLIQQNLVEAGYDTQQNFDGQCGSTGSSSWNQYRYGVQDFRRSQ